jgi:hypothetical protein
VQGDVAVAGKDFTESVRVLYGGGLDRVIAVVSDASGNLFAARCDGAAWTVESPALETGLSSTGSAPFDALQR